MVAAFTMAGIDLLFPMVTRRVLNEFIPNEELHLVFIFAGALFILYMFRFVLAYIVGYYGHLMGIRIETDMRRDLYHAFQGLDYQYFDDKKTGELMTNLTTHLHDVSEMTHHAPEDLFISFIILIGSFSILLTVNIQLTLIVFFVILMLAAFTISRRKKMQETFRYNRQVQGELAAEIESSLVGIRLTKAYSNEAFEKKKFKNINHIYGDSRRGVFREIALFTSGNDFLINMSNLALLLFGAIFVLNGEIDYTDLLTYFLYVNFLIKPVARLANSMEQIQQGLSGVEKFYKVMQTKPSIVSNEEAIIKEDFVGEIEFRDVSFTYKEETTHVLENFSLLVKPGEKIALVGETGVGKSTISKLIPRFYDVNEGEILVDGINVKDYDLFSLRNAIGHVQQDVVIFWGSIKDNILYGNPDATLEEVIDAAKKAKIHEFVMTLEEGYDTLVGERGVKLSGGQKQRLSIARLFLKNPKMLVLDEATSSLDNITEQLIQEAIEELAKGRTTLMIAHRLSTIKNADRIVVLSKEGISEVGTHRELIEAGGYYASLYQASIHI